MKWRVLRKWVRIVRPFTGRGLTKSFYLARILNHRKNVLVVLQPVIEKDLQLIQTVKINEE